MHLSTEELPKLFTDADPVSGGDEKISMVKFEGKSQEVEGEDVQRDIWEVESQATPEVAIAGTDSKDEVPLVDQKNDKDDDAAAASRNWLLNQYQYDDADEEEEDGGDGDMVMESSNDVMNEATTSTNTQEDVVIEKSVEERRLEKLEQQIKEDRESLNDDVANYMRSKYEIADLKKQLKKAEQQANGLRAKISKRKAKEAEAELEADPLSGQDDEMEDNYNGGIFGMFDEDTAPARSEVVAPTSSSDTAVYEPERSADIPSGWTGKLPKELLLEECRRKKLSKPIFIKMRDGRNGCLVRIKLSQSEENVIEEKGPFTSFKDAEHFASTRALYELDPRLPLYQLLPPVFRALWKGWVDGKTAEKMASMAKEEAEKYKHITDLVQSIHDALPEKKKVVETNHVVEEMKELDNWDDESWDDEKEDKKETNKAGPIRSGTTSLGEKLRDAFKKKESTKGYQDMKKMRSTLPMYSYRRQLLDAITENSVTVLCAETGKLACVNDPTTIPMWRISRFCSAPFFRSWKDYAMPTIHFRRCASCWFR